MWPPDRALISRRRTRGNLPISNDRTIWGVGAAMTDTRLNDLIETLAKATARLSREAADERIAAALRDLPPDERSRVVEAVLRRRRELRAQR